MLTDVLVICAVFVFLLCHLLRYLKRREPLYRAASVVPGPRTVPIFGNALLFMGSDINILQKVDELFDAFPTHILPARAWLGPKLYFLIARPEDLELVLNAPQTLAKDDRYSFANSWLGTGIFTAPVEKWRRHRRVISPTFNARLLESFAPTAAAGAAALVRRLRYYADKAEPFDCFTQVSRCSLDIVCETAMGISMEEQSDESANAYLHAAENQLDILYQRMFKVWLSSDLLFRLSGLASKERENLAIIHGFSRKVVEMKLEQYHANGTKKAPDTTSGNDKQTTRKAFLDQLIEQTQHFGSDSWTGQQLQEEVDTMILGGTDTSATMVAFTLMTLGMHQDIQQKVIDELRSVFGDSSRSVEYCDLPQMRYLELVIKETMRLFPVAPFIVRHVTGDLKLENCTLPAGSGCVLSIRKVQRAPQFWGKDADSFRPERFLPENSDVRHPYAYIPFSGGPRNCVGMRFAMLAMKITLSTVLRSYSVKSDQKLEEVSLKAQLMLRPVDGYIIRLEERIRL